jgi:peptidoglycan hydrolase-like protein with peptidoglycan-binding domain
MLQKNRRSVMREQHHRQNCFPGTPAFIGAAVICLTSLAGLPTAQAGIINAPATTQVMELAALGEAKLSGALTLVQRAQRSLAGLGLYRVPMSGHIDAKTRKAVRRFQNRTGLKVDGRITLGLVEILEKRAQSTNFLERMKCIETDARTKAKQALLGNSNTSGLVGGKFVERADPARDIAGCLAQPTSVCLLREAAEIAKAVHKDNMRDWALGEILVAQARANLKDEALRTAAHIQDPRLILSALKDAAIAHAKAGRMADALAAARRVPDDAKQLDAMAAIAEILAGRGENIATERTLKRLLYAMGRRRRSQGGALPLASARPHRRRPGQPWS